MDRCCAWRFINPPTAWTRGVLVGMDGTRMCNEELYGSKSGEHLADRFGGRGVLILDAAMMDAARGQMRTEPMGGFQIVFGAANNYLNHVKADSLAALAERCGIDRARLAETVAAYNEGVAEGHDAMGKSGDALHPIVKAPFYAIDCDLDTVAFPTPCITLGGLVVDGLSARVIREDGGAPIPGASGTWRSGARSSRPIGSRSTAGASTRAATRWSAT